MGLLAKGWLVAADDIVKEIGEPDFRAHPNGNPVKVLECAAAAKKFPRRRRSDVEWAKAFMKEHEQS